MRRLLDAAFWLGFVSFGLGLSLALGIGWGLSALGVVLMVASTIGALKQ